MQLPIVVTKTDGDNACRSGRFDQLWFYIRHEVLVLHSETVDRTEVGRTTGLG